MTKPSLWRWVHIALAALAMVATLPGRTHGLGLFTEPIRATFGLDPEGYGFLNLWATLIGALFCFPVGWLLDRLGPRPVLVGVTAALGGVVALMSQMTGTARVAFTEALVVPLDLFVLVLLTRGLGQSALSVASLSLIARSVGRWTGLAMGTYAFLTSLGFIAAFTALRMVIKANPGEWRGPWLGVGVCVAATAVAFWLAVDNRALDEKAATTSAGGGRTLGQALRSPTFWVFALATSFYGMVVAGTSLFGQILLAERGLDMTVFLNVTIIGIPAGLMANLVAGGLATVVSLRYVLAGGMALLTAALAWFPVLHTEFEAYAYAVILAAAGGVVTVTFFTVWRKAFGTSHLGRIQGAAQFLTVLFSALGPQLFGSAVVRLGSFAAIFPYLAAVAGLLAVAALFTRVPTKEAA